ncbi:hypothetical protein DENIS_0820 [Desulfonema ishimotonii]|uniref:Peptidase M48 domain-containing protein n=1 Tax=Desulfonema ishimotonii TaxID=45657 RepID=A0A401FSD5_9BACT|nr:M48 family metallopeptidase [Desulfonema ishimotonii]GBC59879.1 hypothetical protein DENIS_0820 [Desulfonema ishimotonii]
MFSNFIYFIVVLLIYITYQPSETPRFTPTATLALFLTLLALFTAFTRFSFRRLEKRMAACGLSRTDAAFSKLLTRQSVIAIVLFAANIYGLNLPDYTADLPLISHLPTLEALIFLGLFILYLSITWALAYPGYQRLCNSTISRRSYILSNISFAIPVLLPWICLSGIADLIELLPFAPLKQFLATTGGQMVYFLLFLFVVAIIGPLLIQKAWGCRPLEPGYVRSRIEALCDRAGLEYADILYWPIFEGRMITAGVTGLVRRFRYILVTEALIDVLRPEEIDAVITHEIGHIRRNHLLFYLFFFVGYMLLSYATFDLLIYLIIYIEPLYRFVISTGMSQATVVSTLFTVATLLMFLIYFRYIFGYFMRNFERQADCYVYTLFDTAIPLISTFEKIAMTSGQPPDKPNWHHFSITERVSYLLKCESGRHWIARHDRKVRNSMIAYVLVMLVVGGAGYALNFGEAGKKLSADFFEQVLQREIEKTPHDAELYSLLGDLYYSRGDYAETIAPYERAIALAPEAPQVLNNLAWLYATCETERLREPLRALTLAKRAAALSPEAHILDTLAESYYVNGEFEAAVTAGEQALQKAGKDRSYFKAQLKKFRAGLKTPETVN